MDWVDYLNQTSPSDVASLDLRTCDLNTFLDQVNYYVVKKKKKSSLVERPPCSEHRNIMNLYGQFLLPHYFLSDTPHRALQERAWLS